MKIEMREIASIRPYEKNPRVNDSAVSAVADSIKRFGFRQPIVVDEQGVIIVGHTRLKAALKLGITKIPVHVATGLNPEQIRAYRISDNQSASIATWDYNLLADEIKALEQAEFDIDALHFSPEEMAEIMSQGTPGGGQTEADEIPAPPPNPVTKPGDVWNLGTHRLMCGDSSLPSDLDNLLGGCTIDLVNTDPPYNVKVEPRSNNAIAAGVSSFKSTHHQQADLALDPRKAKRGSAVMRPKDRPLANDFVSEAEFDRLLAAWFGNISRVLVPGGSFYIWGGYANVSNYPPQLKSNGLYFSQAIIWVKGHPVMTRKDFMGNHEWAFYGWREGAGHKFYGPNNATDVWEVKKVNPQVMVHLTEKPVELAVRAIQYSSARGQSVLDLFGGSGSTLMGAEQTERKAFLMEIDPPYCDVIVERWEKFTGKKAVLDKGGRK